MKEIWKNIDGYGQDYQVSNYGRIKSFKRYKEGKLLATPATQQGYPQVSLSLNGVDQPHLVHRLVATHFLPNPENKPQVNHLDGNKLNNRVDNLEWATPQENVQHAYNLGLAKVKSGSESHLYKCSIEVLDRNGVVIDILVGSKDMAQKGYNSGNVFACLQGKRKTHKGCTFRRVV